MSELGIEIALRSASQHATPFYERYTVLKYRLLNNEYEHWATKFSHGNNHGPGHIKRVLANLDRILDKSFIEEEIITPYELFLGMMAILYHDVGILAGREGHADTSKKFFNEENDRFIIEERDRGIISAAVVSHSSSKDIENECAGFSEIEFLGPDRVRPRVVAALVRLADELDEDYRRADKETEDKIGVSSESQFFWEFCQRILAVQPDRKAREIYIGIQFQPHDVGRVVLLQGKRRLFISAFAEKLAKINRERITVCRFLPDSLQFYRLLVSIKPLKGQVEWISPRDFVFNNFTTGTDFIRFVPELRDLPASRLLKIISTLIDSDLKHADAGLQPLEEVIADLSSETGLSIYWNRAIIRSLRASRLPLDSKEQRDELDDSLNYLQRWYQMGVAHAWHECNKDLSKEISKITEERKLKTLHTHRTVAITQMLGANKIFIEHPFLGSHEPQPDRWDTVLHRLLNGDFDTQINVLGGCEAFVRADLLQSGDTMKAWIEFSTILEQVVSMWQPPDNRPTAYLEKLLQLIAAFTPPSGFQKVLSQLQREGSFNITDRNSRSEIRLRELALKCLESYYFVAPTDSKGDLGFRAYLDFLLSKLAEPQSASHACRRLIELRVLEPSSEKVGWALQTRGKELILEMLSHFTKPDFALGNSVISNLYSLCLRFQIVPIFNEVLEQLNCRIEHCELYGNPQIGLFSPRLILSSGEHVEMFVARDAETAYMRLRLAEGEMIGIRKLRDLEAT